MRFSGKSVVVTGAASGIGKAATLLFAREGATVFAADLNLAECLRYAQGHPTLLGEFPAVKAWLERCQARPAFQAMWAARLAEPA